jgi:hypothetical protein
LDKHGVATLCTCKQDAQETAAEAAKLYPNCAPYVAVQLVPSPPASAQDDAKDDITQRLRDNADLDAAEDGNPAVIRLEREAADEIDRLRRALAAAPAAGDARELVEALKEARRELHACQAVIHLAGGFDPAYVTGAQAAIKRADAALSASQQQEG